MIRWGFIGCGSVTEVKSGPAYLQTEGFKVVGVTRRNLDKASDYAQRHSIPKVFKTANELISSNEIDAVYIATPPDTHKQYALEVAAAGKPCCIEKPMAPSYQESLEIYTTFQEKNIPLFVAYYRRSLPRFNRVKKWIDEGVIGKVRHIGWHLSKPPNHLDLSQESNWRTNAKVALGGYFDDLASHGIDLFTYLLGDIDSVKGIATNQMGLYSAKDAIVANWVHKNGVTGVGSWNFGSFEREDIVEIYGHKGKISFSVFNETPLVLRTENGEEIVEVSNPKHIQKYHVLNIKKHLLSEIKHPSLGVSGLHSSWVMDKILGVH